MSFLGVTFPEQKATPSDDAILRQAVLSDGILAGCGLDFAGFTLTMASGLLLLRGREIRHPASESWAVSAAASGYARLILTVDLSKTSTVETFEQVSASIDYASTTDGFPALEQSEINVSGIKYQAEICVMELSTGGITGIIRQMPAVSLRAGSDFLANLLSAGYMQLSGYQLVASVEAIPADAPEGAVFFVTEEE